MKGNIVSRLKGLFIVAFASLMVLSCKPETIDLTQNLNITQTFENGTLILIESINGKELTCKIESTSIEVGQEVVLIFTNETEYDASIDVKVNDVKVGTITKFPGEFKYTINDAGIYQLSIDGTLKLKGGIFSSGANKYFSYGWRITVE